MAIEERFAVIAKTSDGLLDFSRIYFMNISNIQRRHELSDSAKEKLLDAVGWKMLIELQKMPHLFASWAAA